MTMSTNAFATYEAVGNREDLTDIIYNISPTETPFFSAIAKVGAKAVKHEWQTEALEAPNPNNAVLEGDEVTLGTAVATTRLGNIHQISRKSVAVTGTQQAVQHAGRSNEMAHQKMLKGKALRIDIDTILCGTNQAATAGNDTTARTTASVLSWLKTNTSKGAGGADPAAADGTGTRTDGTQAAFTETRLKTVLSSCWTQGGKPTLILTGAFNKQQFSTFTGRATPVEQATSKKIVAAVDAYESDFGRLKVAPSRNMRARDVLVLETSKWAVSNLPGRSMVAFNLARTADTEKAVILSEYALEARNEKASGGVFDCSTS